MKFPVHLIMMLPLAFAVCGPASGADRVTVRDWADQAVLVHRVTKSVCLLFVGASTSVHLDDVAESSARLMARSGTLGVVGAVDLALAQDVATITRSARQIAAGDRHTVAVSLMLRTNPVLSSRYRQKRENAPASVGSEFRGSYALVQELRVLSQKFQRDLCLFLTELAPDDAHHALADDIVRFDQAIEQLISGDTAAGLAAAPNIHIKVGLRKVAAKWATLKPILLTAADGDMPDPRDVQLASVLGDAMLTNFDDVSDRFQAL
ncbi:type IV pili methyl-accepting chemotaxis transducer N-terminal domain-containing protein [Tateyamaria omphalii]|uniref:type IV pili methyl-accepting chemotaxis transducer N-terminal domain-containing protein n=1 Tax=Tateyamaria omphalii TaxID=299262 RepID=UPI001C9A124D|nr:type IV pili methyl-accepting chemotaxis transducer N-terminal domain-containing protein [Tateyamaria omphalii]MBY5934156.1 type IV pili methyl-accepting chemotaxis transducer N-terminal domain-containing protein [Tateyamaria omphalii]